MAGEVKQQSLKEDIIEQIEKLDVLRENGFITSEAYEKQKSELLELL
ncbi:MAG: SHOCT domain-containing protein [Euryarchaeota archaeon]|nr:SHOCT domain-containing protein [Euryarchaeota archaeon]